ncbi:hypothetical protein KKA23_02525 [Patescibacteria group bacterium]|nr:hypothetical protein [Patescibacteria group bacterium]
MEKKQKSFFILIAILIGIGIGIFAWNILTPKLSGGVFYYLLDGSKAKLFLLNGGNPQEITSVDAQEVEFGKYKLPKHTFFSNDGKQMIYFKQVDEEIIDSNDEFIVARTIYDSILVNLKTGKEIKIDQLMDSTGIVFSPNDAEIAWIKQTRGATFTEIEDSNTKREIWISRADGQNAKLLASFDENVIFLEKWNDNYIYFQGMWDTNVRSIGRINVKTRKKEYIIPNNCEKLLEDCNNVQFSDSGEYFLYEKLSDITELYLGSFDREFTQVLTTDRISDRLWITDKEFFYTEQEQTRKEGVMETIHIVNLKSKTDDKIYTGSYVSQLTLDPDKKYLFFLEKAGDDFKLMRLNIKSKKTEEILFEDYNNILLIQ